MCTGALHLSTLLVCLHCCNIYLMWPQRVRKQINASCSKCCICCDNTNRYWLIIILNTVSDKQKREALFSYHPSYITHNKERTLTVTYTQSPYSVFNTHPIRSTCYILPNHAPSTYPRSKHWNSMTTKNEKNYNFITRLSTYTIWKCSFI